MQHISPLPEAWQCWPLLRQPYWYIRNKDAEEDLTAEKSI